MIANLIAWSIKNRFLVLLATLMLAAWGWQAVKTTPLDAIPDLSDVQVIIKTPFPGQSPRTVEDQVTYPITTTMLSVPGANVVRGYSFFGDSYVYVIFADGTDPYWARSRVLEYLNQAASALPDGVEPRLGPDATGVGWVYQYALVDRSGTHDLSELRSLQDWFLKFELQTVPGVSEVASVGGMVRQYQVVADPDRLRAYDIRFDQLIAAIRRGNQEVGGSVMELAEAEYMIRTSGYLKTVADIETIPVAMNPNGTPILVRDVARVAIGPEKRRGIAELDGEGETVGGIIVMRYGENAMDVIRDVRARIEQLKPGLPPGVEVVTVYDRSELIQRAVDNLEDKLLEEFIVVAVVCLIFLFHLPSSLVAIVTLPLGVMAAFIVMQQQGIAANIMSLGGIAIAVGAMVDAAIVMIENAHKHLERYKHSHGHRPKGDAHWQTILEATREVGPALFFSLLIITLSFLPVFTLEAQEGRLFSPLAFTKTYAMAASAGLAVTLVPVLMGWFIRGHIPDERTNPISRFLIFLYRPALAAVLRFPWTTMLVAFLLMLTMLLPIGGFSALLAPLKWPGQLLGSEAWVRSVNDFTQELSDGWKQVFRDDQRIKQLATGIGSEFMPELEEGDLLYMPTTLPGLSIGKAQELLQQTDRLIKTIPEVKRVFGKIGRADTATDPAPLTMIETTILLKDRSEWREGVTLDDVIDELDRTVKFPGLTNAWVQPIKTRIDMLATGIKTPIGIKVAGPDLEVIERIGKDIEAAVQAVDGTTSAYSERVAGGRYIQIDPDRVAAARYGLNMADINDVIRAAVGGVEITQTIEGLERYPVNVRYPRSYRDDIEALRDLPLVTPAGAHIPLRQVATVEIVDGPPMLKSENARLNGWTFVDVRGRDLGSYVKEAQAVVREKVKLPPGYSITWSGQYEYLLRAEAKLAKVVPVTLMIIFVLLYLTFGRTGPAVLVMATLPFALIGGFWLLWWEGFNMSVAVGVGFIALAGVSAEFGVVMLVYLDNAIRHREEENRMTTRADLRAALMEGAVMRVRPKAMTVAVIVAGLIPIFIGTGTGSEVMQRIAAPMIGGMITAPLLSLFVMPAAYYLLQRRRLTETG
ncbi:MAG: efflux RND transporter permease subunit [Gammaproteobacteria bacterium]|nr:efflux RND transporter permease subunit [Gammaproteobacteria bacterium]